MKSLLPSLGIYGWDHLENVLIASIAGDLTILLYGETGAGKTHAHNRISQALSVAGKLKGEKPIFDGDPVFKAVKLDGAFSQEDRIQGFQIPPTQQQINEAEKNGELVVMKSVPTADGVSFARTVLVDEASRIPDYMQSMYLPLLDEQRTVGGQSIGVKFIWGSANPISYAGTTAMDRALANRWSMVVPTPSIHQLPEVSKRKITGILISKEKDQPPPQDACMELRKVIDKTIETADALRGDTAEKIVEYVIAVLDTVNGGIESKFSTTSTTLSPIDGRRYTRIAKNILYVYAASKAREDSKSLEQCALETVKMSMVFDLTEEYQAARGFIPGAIENAHKTHKAILLTKEDQILSRIQKESDPIARVGLAFKLGAGSSMASTFVREARDHSQALGRSHALAFSMVLLSKYQNQKPTGKNKEAVLLNTVMDIIVSDVMDAIDKQEKAVAEISEVSVSDEQEMKRVGHLTRAISEASSTPIGSISLAIMAATYPVKAPLEGVAITEFISRLNGIKTLVEGVSEKIGTIS
jgi:MoxR-like ATPase